MQTEMEMLQPRLADGGQSERVGVSAVAELKERFAVFHRENPPGTRIPADLRAAVVEAIQRGVAPTRLRRSCGLSTGQLTQWRAVARGTRGSGAGTPRPRAFSVVDTPARAWAAAVAGPTEELELRLGRWSVSVRLARHSDAGRG